MDAGDMGGREEGARRELLKLNQELTRAERLRDLAALDRLVADDYAGIDAVGDVLSKTSLMERFGSPKLRFDSLETFDVTARIYGTTGIVVGRAHSRGRYRDTIFGGEFRYSNVYLKRDGRWCVVASSIVAMSSRD